MAGLWFRQVRSWFFAMALNRLPSGPKMARAWPKRNCSKRERRPREASKKHHEQCWGGSRLVQIWFRSGSALVQGRSACGSGVLVGWFWMFGRLAWLRRRLGQRLPIAGIHGAQSAPWSGFLLGREWFKTGSARVQAGSGMIQVWCGNGAGMARNWLPFGPMAARTWRRTRRRPA